MRMTSTLSNLSLALQNGTIHLLGKLLPEKCN
jgi:hypothetical protein